MPAEWVEATKAVCGQPTIVYFLSDGDGVQGLEQKRASAGNLAVATGARVLAVARAQHTDPAQTDAVQDGITVLMWLLGEGCDLGPVALTDDTPGASLAEGILIVARNRRLPIPAGCISAGSSDLCPLLLGHHTD
jgi:hypothetical protein